MIIYYKILRNVSKILPVKITSALLSVICLLIFVTSSFSQIPYPAKDKAAIQKNERKRINLTAKLYDKEFYRQSWENTKRMHPEILQRMQKTENKTDYNIGDKKKFMTYNYENYSYAELDMVLLAKGTTANIWVDTTELTNGHITYNNLNDMLKTLEVKTPPDSRDSTKGIIALDNQFFGYPPNINSNCVKGLGDGRIDFLVFDIKDGFDGVNNTGYVAGYFDPNDQTTFPSSNRRDLLYIDTYPSIYYEGEGDITMALQTMAHEFQHLIHNNYNPNEIRFIDEACSTNAEILTGFSVFKDLDETDYFNNTNLYLLKWSDDNLSEDYARAALWLLYFIEQVGDNFPKALVQNGYSGLSSINSALSSISSSLSFEQLFINWNIANYLNDRSYNTQYGYKYKINGKAKGSILLDPNQQITNISINPLASKYLIFASSSKNFTYKFTSYSSGLDIKMIGIGNSKKIVQNIQSNTQYTEPGFVSDYDTLIFVITNTSNQISNFSLASSGEIIVKAEEITYDDGSPKTIDGVTYLYLPDVGDGWAVKFLPRYGKNKLTKIKMWLVFGQEFPGSSVPSNAPKRFKVHIWNIGNDSLPSSEIITPFIWPIIPRTNELPKDFVSIDLTSLASKLTNLPGSIFIGFTEDDEYYTEIAINNMDPINHSYALMNQNWIPLSEMKVGGNTGSVLLKGWNVMIRAYFEYDISSGVKLLTEESPGFGLEQNYPNPFNPETNIVYSIPKESIVKVTVYDILGRKVKELLNEKQNKGKYILTWNGEDQKGKRVSSGIYLYRLEAGNYTQTKKLNLMK
jgi:hypothetical protein